MESQQTKRKYARKQRQRWVAWCEDGVGMACGMVWVVVWAWRVAWCEDGVGTACGMVWVVVWAWRVAWCKDGVGMACGLV